MNTANLITLTTDFGLDDPYVGQMKGAILKHNSSARIIDLTHAIAPHDILQGAVTIRTSYRYFPEGTIHLVIVDPEVGTQRSILAARAEGHIIVAPDNGLLTLLAMDNRIDLIHRVENQSLLPTTISSTFHGRDIMAPVAAALAGGLPLNEVGPKTLFDECIRLDIPNPTVEEDTIRGHMLHSDRFGNIRTTITSRHLSTFQPSAFSGITVGDQTIDSISTTYADTRPGEPVAVIDSSGYLEIAINRGNAAMELACQPGEEILVHFGPDNRQK